MPVCHTDAHSAILIGDKTEQSIITFVVQAMTNRLTCVNAVATAEIQFRFDLTSIRRPFDGLSKAIKRPIRSQ